MKSPGVSTIGLLVLALAVWAAEAAPAAAQSELCTNADGYAATACRLYCDALSCEAGDDDAQCRRLEAGYRRATGAAPRCGTCTFAGGDDLLCAFGLAAGDARTHSTDVNAGLTLDNVDTAYNPTPAANAPAGVFTITATFSNISGATILDLFFEVAELTGGNLLLNADGGAGGVGARRTEGDVPTSPAFMVVFEIGLQTADPFRFFVDAFGEASCDGGPSCTVFVTSQLYTGNLVTEARNLTSDMTISDGLEAGDRICQHLADNRVPTPLAGTFRAWLSIFNGGSPDTRFSKVSVPYVLVGLPPATVANSYADLLTLPLNHAIDRDESGSDALRAVYTNTSRSGLPDLDGRDCGGWQTVAGSANLGISNAVDALWTELIANPCAAEEASLYCFAQ